MNEPDDHTAWIDRGGDTWVRCDDMPGRSGSWWPLCDGPGWEPWARDGLGTARPWSWLDEHAPFTQADPE